MFLPDGRHFLFYVGGTPEVRGVYVGQLDTLDAMRLLDADSPAVYAATGDVLFLRDGKLLAQAFDPDRLMLEGAPTVVVDKVSRGTTLSASAAGPVAYRGAPSDSGQRQLVWVNRSGQETDKEVYADGSALGPAWSPDGRRIAVFRFANQNMDIWSYEISRRVWDRITFDAGDDIFPLWSRDGTSIVSGSVRTTTFVDLYRSFLGSPQGREELLLSTEQPKFPMDWSADGRFLLYATLDSKRGFDLWGLPLATDGAGERKAFEVAGTDFNENHAQFSPDGQWIAYQSDKTGRLEIYLRPFPGPGSDSLVSRAGGTQVRWNPNGKELFYIDADDRLMAVPLTFSADGKTVEFGTPTALFATNVGREAPNLHRHQYAVSPDGNSFVMHTVVGERQLATCYRHPEPQARESQVAGTSILQPRPPRFRLTFSMDVRFSRARAVILSCVVSFLIATDASAQFGVPFARYRTFETPHFILTFEVGLEDYARRAATRAEAAHALLARAYGSTPRGKIRLVIVDQGDVFNGAATPSPTNRIIAFAHTPVEGELFYTDDPIELLVTHELAHVFHLDEARGGWRVLRRVFGRSELTFPHLFDGSYLIEGLATFYESRLTDGGRVRGARVSRDAAGGRARDEGPAVGRGGIGSGRLAARPSLRVRQPLPRSSRQPVRSGDAARLDGATRGQLWIDLFTWSRRRRSLRRQEPVAGMEGLDRG